MSTYLAFWNFIIPFTLIIVFSLAGALIRREGSFSLNIFLVGISCGILMLIAAGLLPVYMVLFNVAIIVGILFSNK